MVSKEKREHCLRMLRTGMDPADVAMFTGTSHLYCYNLLKELREENHRGSARPKSRDFEQEWDSTRFFVLKKLGRLRGVAKSVGSSAKVFR